jgi:GT2 family glycosyltransferase
VPDYVNSQSYDLHLVGPDGKKVTIRRGTTIRLPPFFDRYVKRGFLKHMRTPQRTTSAVEVSKSKKYRPSRSLVLRSAKKKLHDSSERGAASTPAQAQKSRQKTSHADSKAVSPKTARVIRRMNKDRLRQNIGRIVGRGSRDGSTESLRKTLSTTFYPISNGIGIGILSFNRVKSLRRLISSITRTTDLHRTTIFISDDCSTDSELLRYLNKIERTNDFVIIRNDTRLGIAGNSNRLLRCLERFPHKMLLNDDVEVLRKGWEHFYFKAMSSTKMHHFCLHQPGVYGAPEGIKQPIGNKVLIKVDNRPHGAVMAFDDLAFSKVGYFDESLGYYGMEHVDWSSRVFAAKLQPPGYWDVDGSDKYLKIYPDRSSIPDRVKHLQIARSKYTSMVGRNTRIEASDKSKVSSISCVIPFKDIGRHKSIMTSIDNIRAQRFPCIEMIAVEQDDKSHFSKEELRCMTHMLVKTPGRPFNKSMAFNAGVARTSHSQLLLHDADTLAPAHYMQLVSNALCRADACHFGARVIYANKVSTDAINKHNRVDDTTIADKTVTYFEGGSIACLADTYWKVGGFVEGYWGYGCEDCDFYFRLSNGSRWHENRIIDFIHLWHTRTSGWVKYHNANKEFERGLAELSVEARIAKQHKYLKGTPYAKFVNQALTRQ